MTINLRPIQKPNHGRRVHYRVELLSYVNVTTLNYIAEWMVKSMDVYPNGVVPRCPPHPSNKVVFFDKEGKLLDVSDFNESFTLSNFSTKPGLQMESSLMRSTGQVPGVLIEYWNSCFPISNPRKAYFRIMRVLSPYDNPSRLSLLPTMVEGKVVEQIVRLRGLHHTHQQLLKLRRENPSNRYFIVNDDGTTRGLKTTNYFIINEASKVVFTKKEQPGTVAVRIGVIDATGLPPADVDYLRRVLQGVMKNSRQATLESPNVNVLPKFTLILDGDKRETL